MLRYSVLGIILSLLTACATVPPISSVNGAFEVTNCEQSPTYRLTLSCNFR